MMLHLLVSAALADEFIPPRPTIGPTFTPTPIPIPNPVTAIFNDTSYVRLNLSSLSKQIQFKSLGISSMGSIGSVNMSFSPWINHKCPDGYDCGELSQASTWICWKNETGLRVCFAIASPDYQYTLSPLNQNNDFSKGVILQYTGAYDVHFIVRLGCFPSSGGDVFNFDQYMSFLYSSRGRIFDIVSRSSLPCPKQFAPRDVPLPVSTPEPGQAILRSFIRVFRKDSSAIVLNLSALQSAVTRVAIGDDSSTSLSDIRFSGLSLLGCPSGYDCLGYSSANIWECFNSSSPQKDVCVPIGDHRYGVSAELRGSDLEDGVAVSYGGSGGHSTQIIIQCNDSIVGGLIEFDLSALRQSGNKKVTLYGQSSLVCPGDYHQFAQSSTFGGFFLLATSAILAFYFGVGTIYHYASKGVVSLPNNDLWSSIGESIMASISFMRKLGGVHRGGVYGTI